MKTNMKFDIEELLFIQWVVKSKVADMKIDFSLLGSNEKDQAKYRKGLELEGRFKIAFEDLVKKVMDNDGQ
tara:strand:- start:675 stop:887 length:213 start_codon:yes stop_codon:yes gene_type:complete